MPVDRGQNLLLGLLNSWRNTHQFSAFKNFLRSEMCGIPGESHNSWEKEVSEKITACGELLDYPCIFGIISGKITVCCCSTWPGEIGSQCSLKASKKAPHCTGKCRPCWWPGWERKCAHTWDTSQELAPEMGCKPWGRRRDQVCHWSMEGLTIKRVLAVAAVLLSTPVNGPCKSTSHQCISAGDRKVKEKPRLITDILSSDVDKQSLLCSQAPSDFRRAWWCQHLVLFLAPVEAESICKATLLKRPQSSKRQCLGAHSESLLHNAQWCSDPLVGFRILKKKEEQDIMLFFPAPSGTSNILKGNFFERVRKPCSQPHVHWGYFLPAKIKIQWHMKKAMQSLGANWNFCYWHWASPESSLPYLQQHNWLYSNWKWNHQLSLKRITGLSWKSETPNNLTRYFVSFIFPRMLSTTALSSASSFKGKSCFRFSSGGNVGSAATDTTMLLFCGKSEGGWRASFNTFLLWLWFSAIFWPLNQDQCSRDYSLKVILPLCAHCI